MAIVLEDTFTVGTDVNLQDYSASYVKIQGGSENLRILAADDNVRVSAIDNYISYLWDGVSAPADQEIRATVNVTGQGNVYLGLRMSTSGGENGYLLECSGGITPILYRVHNGTETAINTFTGNFPNSTNTQVRFRAEGTGATVTLTMQVGENSPQTFGDTHANRKTSGQWGLSMYVGGAAANGILDNLILDNLLEDGQEVTGTGSFDIDLALSQSGVGAVDAGQDVQGDGTFAIELALAQAGTGQVANRKLLLTQAEDLELRDENNALVANLSGIIYEWYDTPDDTTGNPDVTGTIATNASGEAIVPLFGTALDATDEGTLILVHPSDAAVRGIYRLAVS